MKSRSEETKRTGSKAVEVEPVITPGVQMTFFAIPEELEPQIAPARTGRNPATGE